MSLVSAAVHVHNTYNARCAENWPRAQWQERGVSVRAAACFWPACLAPPGWTGFTCLTVRMFYLNTDLVNSLFFNLFCFSVCMRALIPIAKCKKLFWWWQEKLCRRNEKKQQHPFHGDYVLMITASNNNFTHRLTGWLFYRFIYSPEIPITYS